MSRYQPHSRRGGHRDGDRSRNYEDDRDRRQYNNRGDGGGRYDNYNERSHGRDRDRETDRHRAPERVDRRNDRHGRGGESSRHNDRFQQQQQQQQFSQNQNFAFLPPPLIPPPLMMPPPLFNSGPFPFAQTFNDGRQNAYNQNDFQRRAYDQERNYRQQQGQGRFEHQDRDRGRQYQGPGPDAGAGGPPEITFSIDTKSDRPVTNLARVFGSQQRVSYSRQFYRDNALGASEDYVNNVQFGCKLTVKEDSISEDTEEIEKKSPALHPVKNIKTIEFFSMSDTSLNTSGDGVETPTRKEDKKSMHDKIEQYNIDLRNQPTNESLWREFVQFQEQVFAEQDDDDEEERSSSRSKKQSKIGRRKAMLEKQVAILDKAVENNPKNLELHVLRLNIMFEVFKPSKVLTEWKKLVATTHAQIAPFWIEYLGFACSDLQIYSTVEVSESFERAFEKFRALLNPDLPEFQRPEKFSIFLADLLLSFSLVLKAAGHTERALSLHQAQLEINFFHPKDDQLNTKDAWKHVRSLMEQFWKLETRRFGEIGAPGWNNAFEKTKQEFLLGNTESSITVSDTTITEFEDLFFEKLADSSTSKQSMCGHWLFVESIRSKLYWVPWRASVSDVDECDDSQRIVPFCDISPFLLKVPSEIYQSEFDRNASYFRYVVNYLILLREDFLPKTYTMDCILSTFTSCTLTESRTLLNEIYYWKKYLNLYHGEDSSSDKVPEGFHVQEFISPCFFSVSGKGSLDFTKPPLVQEIATYEEEIEKKRAGLLKENQLKHLNMIRSVVEQSIEKLDGPFAVVLVQMLLRFEQKNTYATLESHKSLMKSARNLLKNEKVRNEPGAYGEVALLEYFGGSPDKAIDLLVKTINSSGDQLRNQEELNPESEFELITDLCRLYRLLAEFHLKGNVEMSLNILLAMGNNFASIDLTTTEHLEDQKPKKNALLKAKRQFESVLKWLIPYVFENDNITIEGEVAAIARKVDGDKCIEYMLQKSNLIVEWTNTYALLQFLCEDFEAASVVYNAVMGKIKMQNCLNRASKYDSDEVSVSHLREQLYLGWCKIGAMALSQDPLINSKFRIILGNALQEFPSSPPFLVLFAQVESQCSVAGRLWRNMLNLVKQESAQTIVSLYWTPLFMALNLAMKIDELEHDAEMSLEPFGLGGPAVPPDTIFYKLDAILSAAEANSVTKHCPLIWRVHMKHLAVRVKEGKDRDRARTLFYDAIRHCPSSKSIYLDALAYFPDMKKEITDLMAEKQILVRLPNEEFELLMEIDSELKNEVEEKPRERKRHADSDSDVEVLEKSVSKRQKSATNESDDEGELSEG